MAPIIHTVNLRKVYAVGKERVVALNDVSISIENGEFCCIVGQSGSGKSTLLNQLAGLEKPTRGKVFIGSHEISAMTEDELAKFRQAHLGFIFQSYNLLPTMTAAENVALPLMFKGISRSQRLAMARALLHDSPIYIFDEATSNIDVESENDIMAGIHRLAGRKTVILISHRLANVTKADNIYVLDHGHLAGQGTHEALLAQGGLYADLWNRQQALENYGKGAQ